MAALKADLTALHDADVTYRNVEKYLMSLEFLIMRQSLGRTKK